MTESYPMNGGNGTYSYTKNSFYQKIGLDFAKQIIHEEVMEKLDINFLCSLSKTFCLADLGCSVGPNTFFAMQNILEVIQGKFKSEGLASQMPEFQVFFNDHEANDFNTLFTALSRERQYFAAGVPGSFYTQIFPKSSLHFVHSSNALHWLSKTPEELTDKSSPARNKDRIHYANASDAVINASATQFAKDMEGFLNLRAKELAAGGMMAIVLLGTPDGIPFSRLPSGMSFDLLGSTFMDMVKDGLLSEDQVDSFNIPIYAPSPKDITELVERNGCFSILRMELADIRSGDDPTVKLRACAMHFRAGFEGVISKHFGNQIVDELFNRFPKKLEEFSWLLRTSHRGAQLCFVLKRK